MKRELLHLMLFAVFLIAPDARRLWNLFVRNRPADASAEPALFAGVRANRFALGAQLLVVVYLAGMNIYATSEAWSSRFGGGAPKSPLYGIWNVGTLVVDGTEHPPLVTDLARWRRVIFDQASMIGVQQMDDTIVRYRGAVDSSARTIDLDRPGNTKWHAHFTYERPWDERLVIDGTMDGRAIHAELDLLDPRHFVLVRGEFHWVQEYPVNR